MPPAEKPVMRVYSCGKSTEVFLGGYNEVSYLCPPPGMTVIFLIEGHSYFSSNVIRISNPAHILRVDLIKQELNSGPLICQYSAISHHGSPL